MHGMSTFEWSDYGKQSVPFLLLSANKDSIHTNQVQQQSPRTKHTEDKSTASPSPIFESFDVTIPPCMPYMQCGWSDCSCLLRHLPPTPTSWLLLLLLSADSHSWQEMVMKKKGFVSFSVSGHNTLKRSVGSNSGVHSNAYRTEVFTSLCGRFEWRTSLPSSILRL